MTAALWRHRFAIVVGREFGWQLAYVAQRPQGIYLDLIHADRAAYGGERRRAPQSPATRRRVERCVRAVKKRGDGVNPHAVCTAAVHKRSKRAAPAPAHKGKEPTMYAGLPRRDSKGRFLKGSSARRAAPKKRRASSARRSAAPKRTHKRASSAPRTAPRRSAPRRRSSARRSPAPSRISTRRASHAAPRRSASRISRRPGVVVVATERRTHRRRHRRHYAHAPVLLTAGGLAILGVGALAGYEVGNLIHRYAVTYDPATTQPSQLPGGKLPSGISDIGSYNMMAVDARPTMGSILWQGGFILATGVLGAFAPWKWVKLGMWGLALGGVAHLGGQLIDGWIVRPLMKDSSGKPTATGARLFGQEMADDAALFPPASASGTTGAPPVDASVSRRGTPIVARLPEMRPADRTPPALAAGALGAPTAQQTLASMFGRAPVPARNDVGGGNGAGGRGGGGGGGSEIQQPPCPPQVTPPAPPPPAPPPPVMQPPPPAPPSDCGCPGSAGAPPPETNAINGAPYRHPLLARMVRQVGPVRRAA